jgi:hypothetical protein
MADDLGKHGQRDRLRVNINEPHELQAWCAEFHCTPDQLKTAVGRAGVMAVEVLAYLRSQDGSERRPRWRGWVRLMSSRHQAG